MGHLHLYFMKTNMFHQNVETFLLTYCGFLLHMRPHVFTNAHTIYAWTPLYPIWSYTTQRESYCHLTTAHTVPLDLDTMERKKNSHHKSVHNVRFIVIHEC